MENFGGLPWSCGVMKLFVNKKMFNKRIMIIFLLPKLTCARMSTEKLPSDS